MAFPVLFFPVAGALRDGEAAGRALQGPQGGGGGGGLPVQQKLALSFIISLSRLHQIIMAGITLVLHSIALWSLWSDQIVQFHSPLLPSDGVGVDGSLLPPAGGGGEGGGRGGVAQCGGGQGSGGGGGGDKE